MKTESWPGNVDIRITILDHATILFSGNHKLLTIHIISIRNNENTSELHTSWIAAKTIASPLLQPSQVTIR
jgi:hypothetical protein